MSINKKMLAVAAAAGALTVATAIPAMALENEFHGMFRTFGYVTNAYTGGGTFNLAKDAKTDSFVEQRARLMYIAKANDNLKLVTHFEIDSRWGGQSTDVGTAAANKYPIGDSGGLDADRITLETKNVYLDFNCPITGSNVKVGLQPFSDAYKGIIGAWDGSGLVVSKKFDAFTPTFAWFRFTDNNFGGTSTAKAIGKETLDMTILDGKFAVNKDVTVGASYYLVLNDQGANSAISKASVGYEQLHVLGLNAAANVGPAAIDGFFLYEFGDAIRAVATKAQKIGAFAAGATGKVKAGPGSVNAALLYLSGEKTPATGDRNDFQSLTSNGQVSYFNPANMWLLVRQGATINSSTAIGSTDLTKGGRGFLGLFAGYEGTMDKVFYNANIGYGMTAEQRTTAGVKEDSSIGTELNATVGYKLYDSLSVSATVAYAILGDAYKSKTAAKRIGGAADADNPYVTNIQFNYTF